MAKQNSAPDPVSAAMSAIENALNLNDDDTEALASGQGASRPAPTGPAKPAVAPPILKPSAPAETAPLLRPSQAVRDGRVGGGRNQTPDPHGHAGQ